MTGENLRIYINALDSSYAAVARKLGISAQSLDGYLKTQDVKTGLIEKLAKAYDKPLSYFFDNEEDADVSGHHNQLNKEGAHDNINIAGGDLVLEEKVKHLEEIIKSQEAIISEKDERIKDLKDLIEILRTKN
jgi:transcriptional regulator with XRE-family HTH domain